MKAIKYLSIGLGAVLLLVVIAVARWIFDFASH